MNQSSDSGKTEKSEFRKKCRSLWKDKRTYKERLLLAAAPSFALCFTFIFFGPVELTAFNQASVSFGVLDITGMLVTEMVITAILMTVTIAALKGKMLNYMVSALFALTICGYLQGNLLNGHLGALTGDTIDWAGQKSAMLLSLAVWLILFWVPYLFLYFNKRAWRNVVLYGSGLLIAMQAAALVGIYAHADNSGGYYLSNEGIVDYSSENNTIVFLVDRLDYGFVEEVLADDPNFFDRLDGFTAYTNAISEHAHTKPAANFMLTGYTKDMWQIPSGEFFENSWHAEGREILADLRDAGYEIDLYTELGNLFGKGETVREYVSNCSDKKLPMNIPALTKSLLYLSAYRYAPVALKPFFWCYTGDINLAAFKSSSSIYQLDETRFDAEIPHSELMGDNGFFKFYHFNGSHAPYVLNADGTRSNTPTSGLEQTKGCFEIIFRALDKMKELGIYEKATIIITADHGLSGENTKPLQMATRIGLFYKAAGKANEPLTTSKAPVSLANIPATIIQSIGLNHANYGKALDEVGEDEDVVRNYYKVIWASETDSTEIEYYVYEIRGDASDMNNWVNTEVEKVRYSFWD